MFELGYDLGSEFDTYIIPSTGNSVLKCNQKKKCFMISRTQNLNWIEDTYFGFFSWEGKTSDPQPNQMPEVWVLIMYDDDTIQKIQFSDIGTRQYYGLKGRILEDKKDMNFKIGFYVDSTNGNTFIAEFGPCPLNELHYVPKDFESTYKLLTGLDFNDYIPDNILNPLGLNKGSKGSPTCLRDLVTEDMYCLSNDVIKTLKPEVVSEYNYTVSQCIHICTTLNASFALPFLDLCSCKFQDVPLKMLIESKNPLSQCSGLTSFDASPSTDSEVTTTKPRVGRSLENDKYECFDDDINWAVGGSIEKHQNLNNPIQCQAKCQANDKCNAWTYKKFHTNGMGDPKECFLKQYTTATVEKKTLIGYISGPKECQKDTADTSCFDDNTKYAAIDGKSLYIIENIEDASECQRACKWEPKCNIWEYWKQGNWNKRCYLKDVSGPCKIRIGV